MTASCVLLGAVVASQFCQVGSASALTWNLSGVTFADGASATGSFDYDATSNTYSNVAIDLVNEVVYSDRSFNTSNLNFQTSTLFSVCSNGTGCVSSQYIFLQFPALTNIPQTVTLSGNSYGLTNASGFIVSSSSLNGGTITSVSAVPFEFSPLPGLIIGASVFVGSRILKRKSPRKSVI